MQSQQSKMWKRLFQSFGFGVVLLVLAGILTLQNRSPVTATEKSAYTDAEFEQAFSQRDKAIEIIVGEITSLRERVAVLEGLKNEKDTK